MHPPPKKIYALDQQVAWPPPRLLFFMTCSGLYLTWRCFFFARVQIIPFFLSLARTWYEKSSVWIVLDLARYCREIREHLTHAFFETPCTKWHMTMKPLAANSWREFLCQHSPICYQKHFTLSTLASHNVHKQTWNWDGYHHSWSFFLFFIGYRPEPFETCTVCVPSWHYAFLEISHHNSDLLRLSPRIPWQICHTPICTNHCPFCSSPHTNISETNVKKNSFYSDTYTREIFKEKKHSMRLSPLTPSHLIFSRCLYPPNTLSEALPDFMPFWKYHITTETYYGYRHGYLGKFAIHQYVLIIAPFALPHTQI